MNIPQKLDHKDLRIDTLRGLACIFLVLFHIIGDGMDSGLKISDGVLRDFNDLLAYIRMPLFTFLSGYVYALRPFSGDSFNFIRGKARRLLLPMLIAGSLFAIIQSLTPGSNTSTENWFILHLIPVAHFWFVEALFLIFIAIVVLEKFNLFSNHKKALLVALVAFLLYLSPLNTRYFAFSGALYLLPFFLSGMYVKRFNFSPSVFLGIAFIIVVVIGLYFKYPEFNVSKYQRDTFTLILGITACLGLLSLRWQSASLSFIGRYSYAIYIYHVFFTAACRIVLYKLGIQDLTLLISISLIGGLAGPIVAESILNKNSYCKALFLGKRFTKEKPNSTLEGWRVKGI